MNAVRDLWDSSPIRIATDSDSMGLTRRDWIGLLNAARAAGWAPAGTRGPPDVWGRPWIPTDYFSNSAQIVSADDGAAMARALRVFAEGADGQRPRLASKAKRLAHVFDTGPARIT